MTEEPDTPDPSEAEQPAENLVAIAFGALEAAGDLLGERLGGQGGERERGRLVKERSLAVAEQLAHHPRLRAGEHVRHLVAMVLDLAAEASTFSPAASSA